MSLDNTFRFFWEKKQQGSMYLANAFCFFRKKSARVKIGGVSSVIRRTGNRPWREVMLTSEPNTRDTWESLTTSHNSPKYIQNVVIDIIETLQASHV